MHVHTESHTQKYIDMDTRTAARTLTYMCIRVEMITYIAKVYQRRVLATFVRMIVNILCNVIAFGFFRGYEGQKN